MRLIILMLASVCLVFPGRSQNSIYELPIQEHVLDNGLRLLVIERPGDHRVECKIYTDFGSIVEEPGQLGSAHFLEHLMFKGTKTLGTSDWPSESKLIEELYAAEAELIAELNKERNTLRERGVFHDNKWTATTPRIVELRKKVAGIDAKINELRDPGTVMRWYQAYGGTALTATTEQEYMKFDINLPANRAELFLRVESDRMTNTVFRGFDEERMILVEQRLGDLNRLSTPYYEQMSAMVGVVHPVFWPEGYPTDFYQYTRHYEQDMYDRYFVPNNTTIILIGGVKFDNMVSLVEKHFGKLERKPEPAETKAIEPVPNADKRLVYRSEKLRPGVEARFLIPGVGHNDRPVIDVIMEVAQRKLEKNLSANGISGSVSINTRVVHTSMFGIPGSINFEVGLGKESDLVKAESLLLKTIDELKSSLSDNELTIAKKKLRNDWLRTKLDASRLNFAVGHFQVMDSWTTLEGYMKAREAATAADVNRVAATYFIENNRTIGVVKKP
ncbi:MAG: insulinase family protein [Cyclobacteriaceae bacterium]|nr:insulinase family protein [Cyclobacteriaceae bacterium]